MKIRDHLEQQDDTDLDAFITRLTDNEDRVRQNIRQYVVSDKIKGRLDSLLKSVGERLDANRDVGRYIHGAFGSGKSNLLTVLAKMFERDEMVYDLGHPALRELRQAHPFLDRHRALVVRINMMSKTSLTQALFDGYNGALPAGVPRIEFTDEERVFSLIEKDAQRMGGLHVLLEQAANDAAHDIPGMPKGMPAPMFVELYERARKGDREKRLSLAAALQNWRNHGSSPIRPDDLWVDARTGLDRLAAHAKENGFTAIVWLIDELVIWIRGRSRADYVKEINHLSALVDHDAARALPFFAAVAVQMDISRTCPQDLSEKDFGEQMGFIRDRFQPQLELEDQDLYEVAASRVLARRTGLLAAERDAFEAAIDASFKKHGEAIGQLAGGLAMPLVRRLYPFNPALLRILVDVTQALSRNRTAIAALYRLLNRYADLEVGQFIPVGALWAFVFEPENVSYVKDYAQSAACVRLSNTYDTWVRLDPKLDGVAKEVGATRHQLEQVVRTVLLCQLSEREYFPDGRSLAERITVSALVHFNETDIRALLPRTGISKVRDWLRALNGAAPQVQISGDVDATVHIKTEQLDIERVLNTARAQVGHAHRFAYMRRLLDEHIGLDLGTANDGALEVLWRGSKRRGRVKLANVRTLAYAGQTNEFDPGKDEFLILIDYPFDEDPGRSRQDDIDNCQRARARGANWTLAWLPDHLGPSELEALTNAAAVDIIRQDPRQAWEGLSPRDQDAAARMIEGYQADRKRQLESAIRRLFLEHGKIEGLRSSLDGIDPTGLELTTALDRLAKSVLDRRYPNHPPFTRRVTQPDLNLVADWVVRAAKTGATVDLKGAEMPYVDAVLIPLEIAHKAPSGMTRRTDGRYLAAIDQWVGTQRQFEAPDLRAALMADCDGAEKWGFGLAKEVANFFVYYLLQVAGFEGRVGTTAENVQGPGDIKDKLRLVKEEVVDAPTWDKALAVAQRLLDVHALADLPTPPEQAKLCREVSKRGDELRKGIRDIEARLREVCAWAGVNPDASARVRTVHELSAWLDETISEPGNAARTRRLAALHGGAQIDAFARLRSTLGPELAALGSIAGQRAAFEHLAAHGTAEDQTAAVTRLRNLLLDGTDIPLAQHGPQWTDYVRQRFAKVAESTAQRSRSIEVELAQARAAQAEAERQLAAQQQASQQAQRPTAAAASASALAIEGTRDELGGLVSKALSGLLESLPKGAKIRVRLVVERVDGSDSPKSKP